MLDGDGSERTGGARPCDFCAARRSLVVADRGGGRSHDDRTPAALAKRLGRFSDENHSARIYARACDRNRRPRNELFLLFSVLMMVFFFLYIPVRLLVITLGTNE